MRKGPFFLNIFAETPEKEDKHFRFANQRFLRKGKVKHYKDGNKRNPLQSNEGFTLLEILIALVIISVGLLSLASISISVIRAHSVGKTHSLTFGTLIAPP